MKTNETPVGCVLVHKGRIIAKGMNATNVTRNGTRHAELMALNALLSYTPKNDMEAANGSIPSDQEWGDINPEDGHIYPYGQKLHPSPQVDEVVIKECILYVTVEPCVMCASLLRQYGIKKVYFGAVNDKFGGTGGVFRVHKNSTPVTGPPTPPRKPANGILERDPSTFVKKRRPQDGSDGNASDAGSEKGNASGGSSKAAEKEGGDTKTAENKTVTTIPIAEGTIPEATNGDGGNVESGYDVEGGWGRDEAVNLLRQFYVQENGRGKRLQSSHPFLFFFFLIAWFCANGD